MSAVGTTRRTASKRQVGELMGNITTIKDILVILLCVLGIYSLAVNREGYGRVDRVLLIVGLAVVTVGFLVDLVWHLAPIPSMAAAIFLIIVEILLILAPGEEWPRAYILLLRMGYAMLLLSIGILAVWRLDHPTGVPTPHAAIVGFVGLTLLFIAYGALRPRGKPWKGLL